MPPAVTPALPPVVGAPALPGVVTLPPGGRQRPPWAKALGAGRRSRARTARSARIAGSLRGEAPTSRRSRDVVQRRGREARRLERRCPASGGARAAARTQDSRSRGI